MVTRSYSKRNAIVRGQEDAPDDFALVPTNDVAKDHDGAKDHDIAKVHARVRFLKLPDGGYSGQVEAKLLERVIACASCCACGHGLRLWHGCVLHCSLQRLRPFSKSGIR